jgi:hypothetical protein
VPPPMHFHPRWSGPVEGFSHEGYYVGDGHYRYISHYQDMRALGQENQIVQNAKPNHLVSSKTAAALGLRHEREVSKDGPSIDRPGSSQGRIGLRGESSANDQRRRIQWMRAQKMREEADEERDKHFSDIWPVIPTKQEWRVKEKFDTPTPTTSDDDMDLLDDDECPLIKDGSTPPTDMYNNMVFKLSAQFKGVEEEALRCVSSLKRSCSRSRKSRAST